MANLSIDVDDMLIVHEQMSKKIVDLVKLMYVLHTKNDENDLYIKQIITSYEHEIDIMHTNANEIIEKYRMAGDVTAFRDDQEKAFERFKRRTELERLQAVEEFNNYQKRVDIRESETKAEMDKKFTEYRQEVDEINQRVLNLYGALDRVIAEREEMRRKLESEIAENNRIHNQRYNQPILT
jgi:hypothetical protein